MEKAAVTGTGQKTDAEYRAELDELLAGVDQTLDTMRRDRPAIERLKAETRTIAARTDAHLAEIRSVLAGMRA